MSHDTSDDFFTAFGDGLPLFCCALIVALVGGMALMCGRSVVAAALCPFTSFWRWRSTSVAAQSFDGPLLLRFVPRFGRLATRAKSGPAPVATHRAA